MSYIHNKEIIMRLMNQPTLDKLKDGYDLDYDDEFKKFDKVNEKSTYDEKIAKFEFFYKLLQNEEM